MHYKCIYCVLCRTVVILKDATVSFMEKNRGTYIGNEYRA